eukprot:jgi/Botrbrau1/18502/Bobra.0072s0081.1
MVILSSTGVSWFKMHRTHNLALYSTPFPVSKQALSDNDKVSTEDTYLTLRETIVNLRKEYNSRDQKCRELSSQLARTEEAAKRALVWQDPKANRHLAKRVLELEKLLASASASQQAAEAKYVRAHHSVIRTREKAEALKQRLAIVLQDQRRLVRQVGLLQRSSISTNRVLVHSNSGTLSQLAEQPCTPYQNIRTPTVAARTQLRTSSKFQDRVSRDRPCDRGQYVEENVSNIESLAWEGSTDCAQPQTPLKTKPLGC